MISVTTADGRRKPEGSSVRSTGGSDSFGKVSVSNSQNSGPWSHNISASALNDEGFRDQANVEKYLLNTKIRREFDNDRSVTAIINLLQNPRSEDPGALTAEQVEADRSQAGKFTEKFDTGQTVNQQSLEFAGLPFRYVAGVEAREQRDDRIRSEMSFSGDLQGLTANELQTATALGTFAQGDLSLTDQLILSIGGRFDRIRLKVDDDFSSDGDRTAKSLNHELGLRGELNSGIDYDLTLFWVDVRDELIPYELTGPDDRTLYRNAGNTTRKGFESAAGWLFSPSWRAETALTLAGYEFDKYRSGGDSYGGNRQPGLPEEIWSNRLQWQGLGGMFATLETRYIGDMVADDANDVEVDDYWLVNLRGGNTLYADRNLLLKGFVGVRNLGDKDHFANVRINASNNRYFEPASGRTWYAGLEFVF